MKKNGVMQGYYTGWIAMLMAWVIKERVGNPTIETIMVIVVFIGAAVICTHLEKQ